MNIFRSLTLSLHYGSIHCHGLLPCGDGMLVSPLWSECQQVRPSGCRLHKGIRSAAQWNLWEYPGQARPGSLGVQFSQRRICESLAGGEINTLYLWPGFLQRMYAIYTKKVVSELVKGKTIKGSLKNNTISTTLYCLTLIDHKFKLFRFCFCFILDHM